MLLYRQWVYTREEEDRGKAQVIIAKQRNGPTGTVNITFLERFARFENQSIYENEEEKVPFKWKIHFQN